MVRPRKNDTSPTSGTESTPARCVCRKKLAARNGTRPCWIRSNDSSNVFAMNQNTLPTSRKKLRERWPIPWATKTGGLAFAMARESSPYFRAGQRAKLLCESDASSHRTPKHFVRNAWEVWSVFAAAFGVRTRPRVAFSLTRRHAMVRISKIDDCPPKCTERHVKLI